MEKIQITINEDNSAYIVYKGDKALVKDNVLTFKDKKVTLTKEQEDSLTAAVQTALQISKGVLGRKTVTTLLYSDGVLTVNDNQGGLLLLFEKDFSVKDKALFDEFKKVCNTWKSNFTSFSYKYGTLAVDEVAQYVPTLENKEDSKVINDAVDALEVLMNQ